jgi:hypothetical protein
MTVNMIMSAQDRTNLSFAAIQLNRDLQFSEYVYGLVRPSSDGRRLWPPLP